FGDGTGGATDMKKPARNLLPCANFRKCAIFGGVEVDLQGFLAPIFFVAVAVSAHISGVNVTEKGTSCPMFLFLISMQQAKVFPLKPVRYYRPRFGALSLIWSKASRAAPRAAAWLTIGFG